MGDFFGGLRSGIQFPQVVMNQGPLPGAGGLPAPLHETPDARINYGSSLLGDLTPYAYGEPGYLSSQNAYLNIPHKIQKIVPLVYLPEAKLPAKDLVDVSHPVDDADIAFVLRLNRNSMFCTGLKNSAMRRAGLGTAIDPLINLCTLNYILSGMQLGVDNASDNLWVELLMNLDKERFGRQANIGRDYTASPITLGDIIHVIRQCIRPFGIVRGSEKQGGQSEATLSAATWPVSFVVSLTIDGKESNVLNIWHHHELHAGNDLVLRLKPMPVRPYTLNHYYKAVKRQTWDSTVTEAVQHYVWQLVPDLLTLDLPTDKEMKEMQRLAEEWPAALRTVGLHPAVVPGFQDQAEEVVSTAFIWQQLGYWHIGRSQVQTGKYGEEEYWHNDLANHLRTNHLDITFQPVFETFPVSIQNYRNFNPRQIAGKASLRDRDGKLATRVPPAWQPSLRLEQIRGGARPAPPAVQARAEEQEEEEVEIVLSSEPPAAASSGRPAVVQDDAPDWLSGLEFTDDVVVGPPAAQAPLEEEEPPVLAAGKKPRTGGQGAGRRGRGAGLGGSLLKADGTSEPSLVGML